MLGPRPENLPSLLGSLRWRGEMDSGKSAALRRELRARMAAGRRPVGWVPGSSDVGLRTERVDLATTDAALELGAGALQGRLVRSLSSGERQRVRLAEALAPGVEEIALDEPGRHLDPRCLPTLGRLLERRQRQGAHVLACDLRATLPAALFERELGRLLDAGAEASAAPRPRGPSITLAVVTPCLLGAPAARKAPKVEIPVRRGDLVAVTGPNGSGKTSLLEALAADGARRRLRIGLARQDLEVQLFERSPRRELVAVEAAARPAPPWLAAAIGGRNPEATSDDTLERLAALVGLSPWLDRAVGSLPIGALGMLGTALALLTGGDLVLLDEPTQGLDQRASRALARLLVACATAGARLVVATHDAEILAVTNGHWQLEAGRLERGAPQPDQSRTA